jgi:hypothetical protein
MNIMVYNTSWNSNIDMEYLQFINKNVMVIAIGMT